MKKLSALILGLLMLSTGFVSHNTFATTPIVPITVDISNSLSQIILSHEVSELMEEVTGENSRIYLQDYYSHYDTEGKNIFKGEVEIKRGSYYYGKLVFEFLSVTNGSLLLKRASFSKEALSEGFNHEVIDPSLWILVGSEKFRELIKDKKMEDHRDIKITKFWTWPTESNNTYISLDLVQFKGQGGFGFAGFSEVKKVELGTVSAYLVAPGCPGPIAVTKFNFKDNK